MILIRIIKSHLNYSRNGSECPDIDATVGYNRNSHNKPNKNVLQSVSFENDNSYHKISNIFFFTLWQVEKVCYSILNQI